MSEKKLTTAAGCPVVDNQNTMTAGPRGPVLLQDVWLLEKLAHFDREVIPERRMHAKGSGAYGTFTVTHDITKYTRAKIFSQIGKQTFGIAIGNETELGRIFEIDDQVASIVGDFDQKGQWMTAPGGVGNSLNQAG